MSLTGPRFSSESAPWPFHYGIRGRGGTIFWAPYRQANGRSKRPCDLTSSIVPRGTSFHHSVELRFSPIVFGLGWLSCCCDFLGPPELGAVNPYAVHDDGQPTRQHHDRPTVDREGFESADERAQIVIARLRPGRPLGMLCRACLAIAQNCGPGAILKRRCGGSRTE
jgi:hypothetical protein